jgi:hypothetical protein
MPRIRIAPHPVSFLAASLFLTLASASQAAERPDCVTRLARLGIKAGRSAAIAAPAYAVCIIAEPVILISIPSRPGQAIQFPDRPLLSCAMAERLARFSADIAAPTTLNAFGKPLVSISTGPGYECRPRNRVAGAKISSHGQGNAVDILTMELSGGQTVSVEKPEGAEEVKFLAGLRAAACEAFNTVLGPGSDPSHANHIHIDIEPRGKTGNSKFCQ